MKKFLLAIAILVSSTPSLFAMSMFRPPVTCETKAAGVCGDKWVPNFPWQAEANPTYKADGSVNWKLDANGAKIPNPAYDPKKPSYNPATYDSCKINFLATCKD